MKLLLIEDNPQLQTSLRRSLERRGMTVAVCADGLEALPAWRAQAPDLVLLDLSLPGLDGLQVLGQARAAGLRTPVIILTARGTVGDKILGLNQGADDYLPKPFDLDELEARIRALVRRLQPTDTTAREQELALLRALLSKPGHAIAKERLFEQVFPGESEVQYDAIEVVVYRLRRKIAEVPVQIVTLRGLGYLLKAQA